MEPWPSREHPRAHARTHEVADRSVPGRAESREETRLSGRSVESDQLPKSDVDQRRFPDDRSIDTFDGAKGGRVGKVQKGENHLFTCGVLLYSAKTCDPVWFGVCAEARSSGAPGNLQEEERARCQQSHNAKAPRRTPAAAAGTCSCRYQWKETDSLVLKVETCAVVHLQLYFKLKKHGGIKRKKLVPQHWSREPAMS